MPLEVCHRSVNLAFSCALLCVQTIRGAYGGETRQRRIVRRVDHVFRSAIEFGMQLSRSTLLLRRARCVFAILLEQDAVLKLLVEL